MNNAIGNRWKTKYSAQGITAPSMTAKIWEHFYKCKRPAFQSRSVEDIRANGVMITGIKEIDDGLKDVMEPVYLTIDQMVEYYRRGVPISVIEYKDTEDIYKTVQTHLVNWLEVIRTGTNIGDAPMEDLIDLDRFANTVYAHAKYIITPEAIESALGKMITESQRVNIQNFFTNFGQSSPEFTVTNPISRTAEEKANDQGPARESFGDRFKMAASSLRNYSRNN